jgi:D-alanine--poly(phosphoribitol) ligase subunit 1
MYIYNLGLRFQSIVSKHPQKPSIKFSQAEVYSYEQVNAGANQISRLLLQLGIKPLDVVCLSGKKRIEVFQTILACLKIGAPYSILDPDSPAERLSKIIAKCTPKACICGDELQGKLTEVSEQIPFEIINFDSAAFQKGIKEQETTNLPQTELVTGTHPAYIMFTSGSTGFPKGAVMLHTSVLYYIDWNVETFGFTGEDILTNVNPLYFDNSVFDIYSSLFTGACLVPFTKNEITNPLVLLQKIDDLKCSSWFSVPSLLIFLQTMKAFTQERMLHVKRFIFGGEGYPKAKLKELFDLYHERATFYNVYGPTECTCMCSAYILGPHDFENLQGFPPLGAMANNFSYLILDDEGKKVADNQVGELCLLGPNVGAGYYKDPDRTADQFIQNPYNTAYPEIMYCTGDLVSYNTKDGKIYIKGRTDNQIKHMGHRIELEEIENAISQLKYVSQAAAVHGISDGRSKIIGVLRLERNVGTEKIRSDLKKLIPHYMIPTEFRFMEQLPKNANGKVDRKKLTDLMFK